jgi:cobalt-zinc-cadmium efflux system protein
MSHNHEYHGHDNHHFHALATTETGSRSSRVLFAACLNLASTFIELIGGVLTNSVAVLSDALHDLGDSLALFGAYVAERQAGKPADSRHTFGYARWSLFSALIAAIILVLGSLFILSEAIARLINPEPVEALWVMGLAVFGIGANFIAYKKLHSGHSANERMLSWHLLEDVLGWVAVLVGSAVMHVTGWFIIDPILTIAFTLFILFSVFKNLREVVDLFLQGVPRQIDIESVKQSIILIPGVASVHDVHIWSLDGASHIFTGHIVLSAPEEFSKQHVYAVVRALLQTHRIVHTTIEFETSAESPCLSGRCD